MNKPAGEADYAEIRFADMSQVAAFVAALSRALASPAADRLRGTDGPVECWSVGPGDTRLYLSERAVEVVTTMFAAPVVTGTINGAEMPAGGRLLLSGFDGAPLGIDEATEVLRRA